MDWFAIFLGGDVLFAGLTPIVLVDRQEFRRIAFANLLTPLLSEKNVLLLTWDTVDLIRSEQTLIDVFKNKAPVFLLNVGVNGLRSSQLAGDVSCLRNAIPACQIVAILETDWKGETDLAISLGLNGVISTCMPPRDAITAIDVALNGASYFPHVVSKTSMRIDDTAVPRETCVACEHTIFVHEEAVQARIAEARDQAVHDKLRAGDAVTPRGSDLMHLSPRQLEVLKTIQSGMSNKEIARALGLSEATVKIHVRHLMRKFGAGNRTQVAMLSRH